MPAKTREDLILMGLKRPAVYVEKILDNLARKETKHKKVFYFKND